MRNGEELIKEAVDWDEARVDNQVTGGTRLTVRGRTPIPMDVKLQPSPIGIAPSEYRGIELVGYHPAITPEVETAFDVSIDLDRLWGPKGVVLIGKTMRQHFPQPD